MRFIRTFRLTLKPAAGLLVALACASLAHAASDGRVPARLTSEWQGPRTEDLVSYLSIAPDWDTESTATPELPRAIKKVRGLLAATPAKATKARLLLRLVGMLRKQGDATYAKESEAYSRAYEAYLDTPTAKPPTADHQASQSLYLQAVDTFRAVLDNNPKYAAHGNDMLGYGLLLALVKSPNAVTILTQVATDHPTTQVAARAQLALGEVQFSSGKSADAARTWSQLLKAKDSVARDYAKYRLAWLRVQDQKGGGDAARTTTLVFELARQPACAKNPAQVPAASLCSVARDDLVYLWSQADNANLAKSFFKETKTPERYWQTLERIAWLRAKEHKPQEAAAALATVMHEAPARARTPQLYARLIDALDLSQNPGDCANAVAEMSKVTLGQGAWAVAFAKQKEQQDAAKALFALKAKTLAETYYRFDREKHSPAHLAAAARLYGTYLEQFAKADESYSMRFIYAEILVKLGQPAAAAAQYMQLATATADSARPYQKPAAEQMLALQQKLALDAGPVANAGHQTAPLPIPAVKLELQKVIDVYATLLPEKATIPSLKFKAAMIAFDYGHTPEAVSRFDALTKASPQAPEAASAVKTILALYTERKDWSSLLRWAKDFLGRRELQTTELTAALTAGWKLGLWQQAEAYAAAKKATAAATTFANYQQTFPNDAKADQALARSSDLLLSLGQGHAGIKPCALLIANYPNSTLRSSCLLTVASVYEQLLDYNHAGQYYGLFADAYPTDPRTPALLLQAAQLYSLENTDMATVMIRRLVHLHANAPEAATALILLGDMKAKGEQGAEALSAYDEFITRYGKAKPDDALYAAARGALLTLRKDPKLGMLRLDAVDKQLAASPATVGTKARSALAAYRFYAACASQEELELSPSGSSLDEYRGALAQVQTRLKAKEAACAPVLRLNDPDYTVAADYELGLAYAKAIAATKYTPHQGDLPKAEYNAAVSLREALMLEAQGKMKMHWEEGLKVSDAAKRSSPWQKRTLAQMARLAPERYTERFEMMLEPTFTSQKLPPAH